AHAGVVDQELGVERVGAVDDDVPAAHHRVDVVGLDARAQRLDLERGKAAYERIARGGDLVASHVVGAMQDLPIQVRALDDVVIDDAERPDVRRQSQQGRAAQSARANDEHATHAKYSSSEK